MKKIIVCRSCNELKEHKALGLCLFCYNKEQYKKHKSDKKKQLNYLYSENNLQKLKNIGIKKGCIPWNKNKKCPQISKSMINFYKTHKMWNWRGGVSFEPYGFEFNEQLKEIIRQRDNFICQFPNCNLKENGQKLDVHHIDYNKKNNQFNNLISLCHACNIKVNYNRNYWTSYFQNKIILRS